VWRTGRWRSLTHERLRASHGLPIAACLGLDMHKLSGFGRSLTFHTANPMERPYAAFSNRTRLMFKELVESGLAQNPQSSHWVWEYCFHHQSRRRSTKRSSASAVQSCPWPASQLRYLHNVRIRSGIVYLERPCFLSIVVTGRSARWRAGRRSVFWPDPVIEQHSSQWCVDRQQELNQSAKAVW
jgi:hypothetical protein